MGSDDGGVYALQARTGPADSAPARAVFWDESISYNWFAGHKEVRDYLAGCGYEVLDSAALVRFLRARVADHRPSVVVFAMDNPPASISAGADGPPLIRRYLDAGGKVLWLGVAPFALKIDPNTHKPSGIDFTAARKILDVDQTGSLFDTYGASATAAGRRWGLPTWWVASWTVDPAAVSTVLSLDETDRAAAWVKAYGGPDGTGFVRIWGRKRVPPDLEVVRSVAEFGLH